MQPRDITVHSATSGTSFQKLANALTAILTEQGMRVSPAVWTGEAARQICLAPFHDNIVFNMDGDSPVQHGVITQSWADLIAEVEAELASEVEAQHRMAEQGASTDPLANVALSAVPGDTVVLPFKDMHTEPSVGIIFVITREQLSRLGSGEHQMAWALSAVHNDKWYRVLAREPASGELMELQSCGLNVLGAVGRLQREGLLENPT